MRGLPLTGFPIGFTGAFLSTWALSSFMYSETLEFVSITLVLAVLTALLSAFLPQKNLARRHENHGWRYGRGPFGGVIGPRFDA